MEEQLRLRLEELKKEFETGQNRLRELELQQANVQQTLLRISGAIQVLEEMLVDAVVPQTEPSEGVSIGAAAATGGRPVKAVA